MPLDFRNANQLWASVMAETLQRLGLRSAVLCPGSRCAPLTIAFAQHPQIEAIPVLDERSAGFFALGLARQQHRPVVLLCTSGTAGANLYPAVIEARESGVPLVILSADRPPELRNCHAGQAIDQVKLFGQYPNWQAELGLPRAEVNALAYLRQTLLFAWEQAIAPSSHSPGPVHLNCPLREPLAPLADPATDATIQALAKGFDAEGFFQRLSPLAPTELWSPPPIDRWRGCQRGLIVVGLAQPEDAAAYTQAIAQIAARLGWPVLCDALNPLRGQAPQLPGLICHYDPILRQPQHRAALAPDLVLRLGELPTSKVLRQWLAQLDCPQWIVSDRLENFDPLHGPSQPLRCGLPQLAQQLQASPAIALAYRDQWCQLDYLVGQAIDRAMAGLKELREPKLPWLLSQVLPPQTPLFVANSTPVRDMEWFWRGGDRPIQPAFNRGANGIDGTLSTALGLAHGNRPTVLLTGDLALLHDTNGWLLAPRLRGHLTILLINNNGGGIFELLPIAGFEPPFEEFFAMPQSVQFATLCQTYGADYEQVQDWDQLSQRLQRLPEQGLRLLELKTDRKADRDWRSQLLERLGRLSNDH